jgi:hypothetical protein
MPAIRATWPDISGHAAGGHSFPLRHNQLPGIVDSTPGAPCYVRTGFKEEGTTVQSRSYFPFGAIAALAKVSLAICLASSAWAACGSQAARVGLAGKSLGPKAALSLLGAGPQNGNNATTGTIVGLWSGTLYVGSGPAIYDQQFDTWFADGNELAVDNAVPPVLGNVCVGTWIRVGPQTYQLRHVTWNWNLDGSLAGTFLLLETVTLDPKGNAFKGTYVSDSFDLDGNVIPALHAEGDVVATRITAN